MNWISIKDQNPPFIYENMARGGEKSSEQVDVKFNNGTTGEGVFRDNPYRSRWMTRQEPGFLYNIAWSGIRVTHWKEK